MHDAVVYLAMAGRLIDEVVGAGVVRDRAADLRVLRAARVAAEAEVREVAQRPAGDGDRQGFQLSCV